MAFSPDGSTLAVTAEGRVLLWNLADRKPSAILADDETGFGADINELAFSPDGRFLAGTTTGGGAPEETAAPGTTEADAAKDSGVRLWKVPTKTAH
ncbi:hypothetical protein ABZ710_23775 [Streptomyces anthocyanicus]